MVPSDTKNQSDQNKTFRDVLGGLWVLGRMFGHEFHALVIFQKFLIADDFAALFGSGSLFWYFFAWSKASSRVCEPVSPRLSVSKMEKYGAATSKASVIGPESIG